MSQYITKMKTPRSISHRSGTNRSTKGASNRSKGDESKASNRSDPEASNRSKGDPKEASKAASSKPAAKGEAKKVDNKEVEELRQLFHSSAEIRAMTPRGGPATRTPRGGPAGAPSSTTTVDVS